MAQGIEGKINEIKIRRDDRTRSQFINTWVITVSRRIDYRREKIVDYWLADL